MAGGGEGEKTVKKQNQKYYEILDGPKSVDK